MKQLVRISIDGLKSHDHVSIDVPAMLAIHGPNGSGKTTIFQAVRLAVLGYEPSLNDKRLAAVRQLIAHGHQDAEITLEFSDGFAIRRRFGASTETKLHPTKGEHTEKQAQARINAETGAFVPAFDLAEFLALSAEKRRAYLLALLPREAAGLDESTWRKWLGYEAAADNIRSAIEKLWNETVLKSSSLVDGLASALEQTTSAVNDAERDRREQEAIAGAAARDAEASARSTDFSPERMGKLQDELHTATTSLAEFETAADRAVRARTEQRGREEQRARLVIKLEDAAKSVSHIEKELESLEVPTEAELSQARTDVDYFARKERAQPEAIQYAAEQLAGRRAQLEGLTSRRQLLADHAACPTCGSTADLPKVREELDEQIRTVQSAVESAQSLLEEAQRRQMEYRAKAQALTKDLDNLVARANFAASLRTRLDDTRTKVQALSEQLAQLEALPPIELAPPDAGEIERLNETVRMLRAQIDAEGDKAKLFGRAEGDRIRADREQRTLEKKTARAQALKALQQAQQALRAHVIQQLVVPVEKIANELLSTIDPAKQFRFVFEREGKAEFDFGFEEAGVFRSYDAASTGEDAFLAVVLVAALISVVAPPWRILMVDNAESIDASRRQQLLRALNSCREYFDNVIIAGCCDFNLALLDGWEDLDMRDVNGRATVRAA